MELKDLIKVVDINEELKLIFDNGSTLYFHEGKNEAERNGFLNSFGDREVKRLYAWDEDAIVVELKDKEGE